MSPTSKYRLNSFLTWLVVVTWTLVVGGSLFWTLRNDEKDHMDTAYAEARANLNKDITLRRWISASTKGLSHIAKVDGLHETSSIGHTDNEHTKVVVIGLSV